ncbi:hypothetical protein PAP_07485 [Palaeococcus pacificus DY20341]|uniref:DUF835 domain-containing protein n=1 Tax=Palaeococcus pacificus DY20341 TaxID=1343739 RepID=A0A075LV68_9EURY|nr:DUF835 domain-containing protein [Palaeococcus pacificus]AIF69887.1 hypothetical protein PAP_07485 [Palaeococcus pacificus DY20341]
MPVNFGGIIAGLVLIIISIYGILRVFNYYKSLKNNAKQLAGRVLMSFVLLSLGGVMVIFDSLIENELWFITAILVTSAYILSTLSDMYYLDALAKISEQKTEIPPSRAVSGKREKKETKIPVGAFIVTPQNEKKLKQALKMLQSEAKGLFVVSRMSQEDWEKKFEVKSDFYIWLSRVESPNAVDPSKLHVILEEAIKFMKNKGGEIVIYIEGIEYIMIYSNFNAVVKFLFSLKDHAIIGSSMLLLSLDPQFLEESQYSVLLREFELFNVEKFLNKMAREALFGAIVREEVKKEAENSERDGGDKGQESGSGEGQKAFEKT